MEHLEQLSKEHVCFIIRSDGCYLQLPAVLGKLKKPTGAGYSIGGAHTRCRRALRSETGKNC